MHESTVDRTIHAEDFIFRFCAGHPHWQGEGRALEYYLTSGRDSALRLRALVLDHVGREQVSLLEFAAGYGCVTRHLADALPQADITACDIHNAAVRFIKDQFGIETIGSVSDPDKFSLGRKFDVVFALSFFSHMPNETWARWLEALARHTVDGGAIIFTTHGLRSTKHIPDCQLDTRGFFFKPDSEQGDLSASEYGTAVTTFDYVYRQISKIENVSVARFHEGLWWEHQDLYVVRRATTIKPDDQRAGWSLRAGLSRWRNALLRRG